MSFGQAFQYLYVVPMGLEDSIQMFFLPIYRPYETRVIREFFVTDMMSLRDKF